MWGYIKGSDDSIYRGWFKFKAFEDKEVAEQYIKKEKRGYWSSSITEWEIRDHATSKKDN